jgi:hypothetical protein
MDQRIPASWKVGDPNIGTRFHPRIFLLGPKGPKSCNS